MSESKGGLSSLLPPSVISLYAAEHSRLMQEMNETLASANFDMFFYFYMNLSPDQMDFFNRCVNTSVWSFGVRLRRNNYSVDPDTYLQRGTLACRDFLEVNTFLSKIDSSSDLVGHAPLQKISIEGIEYRSFGDNKNKARLLFDILALSFSVDHDSILLDQASNCSLTYIKLTLLPILSGYLPCSKEGRRFVLAAKCLRKFVLSDVSAILAAAVLFEDVISFVLADFNVVLGDFVPELAIVSTKMAFMIERNVIATYDGSKDASRVFERDYFDDDVIPRDENVDYNSLPEGQFDPRELTSIEIDTDDLVKHIDNPYIKSRTENLYVDHMINLRMEDPFLVTALQPFSQKNNPYLMGDAAVASLNVFIENACKKDDSIDLIVLADSDSAFFWVRFSSHPPFDEDFA